MRKESAPSNWMFRHEIPIPQDVANLMAPGEQTVAAYATFRDSAIFTTKRLIVRDTQGLRGKKVEVYSLPYSSINMWSSENTGSILDFTGELELWTRAGKIKISVGKRCPATGHADRHVCAGGVGQPETTARPAAAINAHRTLPRYRRAGGRR